MTEKENLNEERATLWLDSFANISLKQKMQLLEFFKTPCNLFENIKAEKEIVNTILGETITNKLIFGNSQEYVDDLVNNLEKQGVKFISRFSENFSPLLKSINTPPLGLYYKGDISLINSFCIGVVGTRHCTHYGADCARKFARILAENGITVVSGLGTGIDTCAHEGALQGGKTISVFVGGVDIIYPTSNTNLAKNIEENGGLIVSEHKPQTPTASYNFPLRSRILSGLCRGILMVEAPTNSGTMHIKEYAVSEHRDVFAIPGNITNPACTGTNQLIRNQEAICALSPEEILNYYYITPKEKPEVKEIKASGVEGQIIDALQLEAVSFEDLKENLSLDTKTLMQTLTKMEIKGVVVKRAGNMYDLKK